MSAAQAQKPDARQRARRWRALPYRWALRYAPVVSSSERLVLSAYADHADPDGTGAYPGPGTLTAITMLDESTIKRARRSLVTRGLMAEGDQQRARRLPSGQRPKVMDLMVPFAWYMAQKDGIEALRDINAARKAQGLPPITAETRPELKTAPERKTRADKGKPKPRKAVATDEGGASSTPLDGTPDDEEEGKGGHEATPREGMKPRPGGAGSTPTAPMHLASDRAASVGDGRRPTTGSKGVSEGGCAASDETERAEKAKPGDLRTVIAGIPSPLASLLDGQWPQGLPTEVNDAISKGLIGEMRTADELVQRMDRRWVRFGYDADHWSMTGGGIRRPLGVLTELLAPSKCWGNNPRCEDNIDLDRGEDCVRCVEAREDRAAERQAQQEEPAAAQTAGPTTPAPEGLRPDQREPAPWLEEVPTPATPADEEPEPLPSDPEHSARQMASMRAAIRERHDKAKYVHA